MEKVILNDSSEEEKDEEQKMEFLSQFFDNEEIEKEEQVITETKENKKKTKRKSKHQLKKRKRFLKNSNIKDSFTDIPDEPSLWFISFIIFSLMGYLFDLHLIYFTPVILVAFIIYLLGKSSIERNKIVKKLNFFRPLMAFKNLIISKRKTSNHQKTKQPQPIYIDDLEHPLLSI